MYDYLSIEDLPNGLSATYSQNPVAPGSTVNLTVSSNSSTTDNLAFNLTASDGAITNSVPLALNLAVAIPATPVSVSPNDNEIDVSIMPTLNWSGAGTGSYEYQVATNAGMTSLVFDGTTAMDEVMITSQLAQGVTHYWRVREVNDCGIGQWSVVRQFNTAVLACGGPQESTDVPLSLGTVGTSTSDLIIGPGDPMESVEVMVNITHSYVGDLRISLQSPDLGTIVLVDRIGFSGVASGCSGNNLELTFSDLATNTAADLEGSCGNEPAASGAYQPLESMAGFVNQAANGTWTLIIEDLASQEAAETECGRNKLIELYPNPVDESRTLQLGFAEPLTNDVTFTVFGADGRKLLDRTAPGSGGRTASLDVAELPAGTYFLRVISGGEVEVRSFVKM